MSRTDGYPPKKINSKIQFLVYNITKLISNFERVCSKRLFDWFKRYGIL